jgi:Alternative oxidase
VTFLHNNNHRIDAEELKELLRKHKNAFTDEEVMIIGEMFYAGRSGAGVPIDRFIEALDQVLAEQTLSDPLDDDPKNPLNIGQCGNEYLFFNSHANYTKEELMGVKMTHTEPATFGDRLAFNAVKLVRFFFDTATGWTSDKASITPERILNRTIYLETIAAVPGMVAAIVRHFRSLRTMQRDGGMLQMFLDEGKVQYRQQNHDRHPSYVLR